MSRAEVAHLSQNGDFWPAQSLASWRASPESSFTDWLAQQRVLDVRQFRESSRETYTAMFSWWIATLKDRGLSLLEASSADASVVFEDSGLEPVSRRRYLQLLDKVYRHLKDIGLSGDNPISTELMKERLLDVPLPPGLEDPALDKLVRHLTSIEGWKGARDRCSAALLIGAGLRVNEFVHLPLSDVLVDFSIDVQPQGVHRRHKTLILPDGPWREWYQDWLKVRREHQIPGDILCVATSKGTAYSPSGLFRRVSSWLTRLDEELDQTGPNILRNTFARQALLSRRYSLEQIQEFLGHEELRATNRHLDAVSQAAETG